MPHAHIDKHDLRVFRVPYAFDANEHIPVYAMRMRAYKCIPMHTIRRKFVY